MTTADQYIQFINRPNIVEACDLIFANVYPYWEGIDLKNAPAYLYSCYQDVVAVANSKEVVISETGWPSAGDTKGLAVPSLSNANLYFLSTISLSRAEGIKCFVFEAFDETWKAKYEGPQGAHWGIWDKEGVMKAGMQDVFDGKTIGNNWSCDSEIGGIGEPEIVLTHLPPKGSTENLRGKVTHVIPSEHVVAVYIRVGGWWTKPTWNNPLTKISCDGSWICDITTGGYDTRATEVAAFLVSKKYSPPLAKGGSLPNLGTNAIAKIIKAR